MRILNLPIPVAPWSAISWRTGLRRIAPALGAVWLALCATPAASDARIEVEAARKGDLIEVRAQATIAAPLAVVWGALTDYEHAPEFVPGLKKSRVIARNGAVTTVEQSGEARFLFLSIPIEVTVEAIERPPVLEVRRIGGSLRHLQGRYETELSADPALVHLRWTGSIAPESELPPLVGELLMRLLIQEQFAAMVREIERREAARRLAPAAPPVK